MIHCPSSAAILPTYGWFTYLPSAGYWSEEVWLRLLHPVTASAAINISDQNDRVLRFTTRLSITREWGLRDTLNSWCEMRVSSNKVCRHNIALRCVPL